MTEKDAVFARKLMALGIAPEKVDDVRRLFGENPEFIDALSDPSGTNQTKHALLDKLISDSEICAFLKTLCEERSLQGVLDVFEAYRELMCEQKNMVYATMRCVTPPDESQTEKIKQMLCKKYNATQALLEIVHDETLVGGFTLRVGDDLYDRSVKGELGRIKKQLKSSKKLSGSSSEQIISVLKSEIENYDKKFTVEETGSVVKVGDGIATVYGLSHAMYGELVEFENGTRGIVQSLEMKTVGCVLLGTDYGITEGTKVVRSGKKAGVPVGESVVGRVVNALGTPIDGKGEIIPSDFYPIEAEAPSVCERKSVNKPLQTGILSIDSMFPIGRGQRELIIGDRQTGKTAIALDTIINQKDQDVHCVYVAIGQKTSTVAQIVSTLKKHGAMDYTTVVVASAFDPAPLQYIAPYAGTAMAEYFMHQGKDVLIVYDDLSKHAVAYRTMSLLLQRAPGREAYPGDVFYLHSRLLERASRLSDEFGDGSLTALPIVETQAGDISAYIPTNVISITDGQLFLESELFFSGIRPAVNVGLSISRVGGAAQTKAMKKAAASLRMDLAQYREMEVFTQFSSDLDTSTQDMLGHGDRLMELLKQPQYHPLAMEEQVVLLCVSSDRMMLDIPLERMKEFKEKLLKHFKENHLDILEKIKTEGDINDELVASVIDAAKEIKLN